jgi:hypothetical protein
MGLTANKLQRLDDASLVGLFRSQRELWAAMAQQAYRYTVQFVEATGNEVRPDDVIPVLVPALEVSSGLRAYLGEAKLSQQYWFTWFGELIVDELWDDLRRGGSG